MCHAIPTRTPFQSNQYIGCMVKYAPLIYKNDLLQMLLPSLASQSRMFVASRSTTCRKLFISSSDKHFQLFDAFLLSWRRLLVMPNQKANENKKQISFQLVPRQLIRRAANANPFIFCILAVIRTYPCRHILKGRRCRSFT